MSFDLNILRYFFQYKRSVNYLEYGIHHDLFTAIEHRAVFEVFLGYVAKYKEVPDYSNLLKFMVDQQVPQTNIDLLKPTFDNVYKHLQDVNIIEEELLTKVKQKIHKNIILKAMESLDTEWDDKKFEQTYKEISKLVRMDVHGAPKYTPLLDSLITDQITLPTAHPTKFRAFNEVIGLGGFFAPQLIAILGGPKSMKTTFLLHLAVGYVESGLNVSYLDWENGRSQTSVVLQQILTDRRVEFLYDTSNLKYLEDRVQKLKERNGNIFYSKLRAKRDMVSDAELLIKDYQDTHNIGTDCIIYDYLDITGRPKGVDKREGIQMAYADAKNMNESFDAFGITISKITRGSKNKDFLTEEDSAEDNEKAYNVDALFAIRRSEEDVQNAVGHIQPIVQRNGESHVEKRATLAFIGETRFIGDLVEGSENFNINNIRTVIGKDDF